MENLTLFRVEVHSGGHKIFFRNRIARTPVVFEKVYEKELGLLESQLKSMSLNYSVTPAKEIEHEEEIDSVEKEIINDDVKIEELYTNRSEPESILDKLIAENE